MNWASLSYQNNINVSTGFFLPDKLPDKLPDATGTLTTLEAGEKIYVYVIFKLQHGVHSVMMKQRILEAKNNSDDVKQSLTQMSRLSSSLQSQTNS